jgi:hypothetical protein
LSKHSPAQATVSPICSPTRSSTPGSRPLARSRLGARVLFSLAAAGLGLCACEATMIPNTRVEDTSENREVVDFVEKYRLAVEERNTPILLSMASENYFDDMGTPAGEDDVDYDALKKGLARMHEDVSGARYQVSYRAVSYAADRHVLVDMMYTGWFRVTPVGAGEPVWKRRLSAHRIVLDRGDKGYKILSGM